MPKALKNHGLTVVLVGLFLASIVGQWVSGWLVENEELRRHGQAAITLLQFTGDAEFLSSVFENWESEFLQMGMLVVLTAWLVQKGSSQSKEPGAKERDGDLARQARKPGAPAMLRWGETARWLYAHSLGTVLLLLFAASFLLHWLNSARSAAERALEHHEAAPALLQYLGDPQLWFESFQNWQSEFMSSAVIVVLSIFLRQRESPESKPVAAPHAQTGGG